MSDLSRQESYALYLVGHLYSRYRGQDPVLSYPTSELPRGISYSKPTPAKGCFLIAQCKVNRTLREYLMPVFPRIYRENCSSVKNFKSFLDNATFHQLIVGQPDESSKPMKLLARFALATELVLYCFRNKCYRLANYLPEYLLTVLQSEEFGDIFTTLTEENIIGSITAERANVPLHGYHRLRNYCQELDGSENHPSLTIFREIGATFQRHQLGLLQVAPGSEPGAREQECRRFNVCGESDCGSYLANFLIKFVEKSGYCPTCIIGCFCS